MSAFTALNGGFPTSSDTPVIKVDSSAAGEPGRTASPSQAPPQQAGGPASRRESVERPTIQTGDHSGLADPSLKRKRSGSAEAVKHPVAQERTPDTATEPLPPPPPPPPQPYGDPRDEARTVLKGEPQQPRSPLRSRERDRWHSSREPDDRSPYHSRRGSATSLRNEAEGRPGEGTSRPTSRTDHVDDGNSSPDPEDTSVSYYGAAPYSSENRSSSVLQHDPKKRKRNFSNRTKTGCMTCRKRKKKCDETKPECQNCLKGGFVCTGYSSYRGTGWQKPENKSPTVHLESKDPSYVPPGAYGMPHPGLHAGGQPQPAKRDREPLPHYRGQVLRIDPPQGRPVVTDDDRPTASTMPSASTTSPDNRLSAMTYTPANAFPTPISANTQTPSFSDRMAKDYQRVPPLHDLSRQEPETPHPGTPHQGGHLPHLGLLHPTTRTTSPVAPGHPKTSAPNPQVVPQLGLAHSAYQPHKRTQKEEMLSGRLYYPFDKELCLERERCAAACWRFNNITTPPNGVSPEERARLFLEILRPRDPIRMSPGESSPVLNFGRVGGQVTVETPFTCDYGYNLIIGNNVAIARNCTISDVCEVRIGDNCVIGPNVSIFTSTLPIDPKRRQGGQGPQSAKPIVIEENCWIAGGAMILAGRTIGKGSTVAAGSIVTKDVPPFTVVAGNPARVLRGIAS
ncbi:Acetyltransferase (isoleucine patch superfamily) [Geosmithia morbida]|uniref:Acetyltransferase (Isoleucine patch superfamily) n=1 Tax=Geosmithia morbida TaxID=1094350 RepID=A0A9P4Z071_9HYPO|nr:Acetyltransferase (isoleucine patch superfamily) [Geosmithia morbida]KAF4126291.1 Acetyltransferase (isoleucine patch superfamily) [Geosmithia morbida]